MAGLRAILTSLGVIVWRGVRQHGNVSSNNFFLFCVLLMLQPESAYFLDALIGMVIFFPLSEDPLRKAPPERLSLWPITQAHRLALRVFSLALNPAAWLVGALFLTANFSKLGLHLLVAAVGANAFALWATAKVEQAPRSNLFLYIPPFPGRLGGLVRKNIREMLHTLDPYLALAVAAFATYFRLRGGAPAEALFMLSMLVVLAMSTSAQRLFALDLGQQFVRYRLLPVRGWEILLAKDAAFFALLLPLVLLLDPLPALAGACAVLAIGHHAAVWHPVPQGRWRFTGGNFAPHALLQIVSLFAAGVATQRHTPLVILPCVAALAISLWHCGRQMDRYQ